MPAVRDWSYSYNTVADTSIACDAPDSQENDLLLAIVTCKTAPQTAIAPPAPAGNLFAKVLNEFPSSAPVVARYMTNNTATTLGGDATCNVTGTTPYTVTGVGKTTTLTADNAFAGRLYPNTTAAAPLVASVYSDVMAATVDISAISIAAALRGVAATDTLHIDLYDYDPAGVAGNGTLVATGATKTLTGGTTVTAYSWIATDFTISGTGRVLAGHRLQFRWYWYSATTASTARIMFGTTGTTTSTSFTVTQTPISVGFAFSDVTTAASNATAGDWSPVSALTTTLNEATYFGNATTFTKATFELSVAGAGGTSTSVWEYWNGSAWVTLTTLTDTTVNWRSPTSSTMTFTAPGAWATTLVNGSTLYWIRSRVTTAGTFTTKPLGSTASEGVATAWTLAYNVVSGTTPAQIVYYRKARLIEDTTFTFTLTSSLANISMLSIRDVNLTTPVDGYASLTTTGQRVAVPTRTTTVANCLNLHIDSLANVGVPSIVEGAVTSLYAKDGTTLADGCAWSIKATAGVTPSGFVSHIGTSTNARVCVVLSLRPVNPASALVPPYCASDLSQYIDPINGTTAFNTNTAFAGTGTTQFGATINTVAQVNATVAARTDVGLNSYHAMGDVGTATTPVAGSWYGASLVLATANKPNVSGKNVLVHTKPYLPVDLQTTTNLTSQSKVKGLAVGLCSTAATATKVFHVSGGKTPWGPNNQPIVVNDQYSGAGVIDVKGSLNPASILALGFFVSGFVVQPNWVFGSVWVLHTTVVAGGTTAEPVTPSALIDVAATGHERMSVTRQGSGQLLVFQPIQFGDGGTNPIKLNFAYSATEFPEQYSQEKLITNYCSVDDVAGYTFYAGATDVMDLRGAVFSSNSAYHWRIHPSSNVGGSHLTEGAVLIGAGDVQFKSGIAMTGMSLANCPTIAQNAASITYGTLTNSTILTTTAADLASIQNCAFTSSGTGHAIEISGTAANVSFTGNTFSGYAATDGSTGNEAIYVNIATGSMTISITGGGSTPSIRTAGATVAVQNAVTVTVTVKSAETGAAIENARVLVEKVSDGSDILTGVTNASGVVTTSYAYLSDTPVIGTVRRASAAFGTLYKPGAISATIAASGMDVTVLLTSDE